MSRNLKKFVAGMTAYAVLSTSVWASVPEQAGAAPGVNMQQNRLLDLVLRKVAAKQALLVGRVPLELVNRAKLEGKIELNGEVKARLDALDKKELTPEKLRDEAVQASAEVLKQQKAELMADLKDMDETALAELVDGVRGNPNYKEAVGEFDVSFTRDEKIGSIFRGLSREMDMLSGVLSRRAGQMSVEGWKSDFNRSQEFFNKKDAEDVWQVLGIAALVIAASGLVTWGISAGIYGARLSSRRDSYENDLATYRSQLQDQLGDFKNQMDQQELDFLKNNGYVYTTCGSWSQPDSIICNGRSYQLFSGQTYCSVKCWKNPTTGKEARFDPASCNSPFVPSDCYDPNEYLLGHSNGYKDGYYDGYWKGASDGYDDGADDGYHKGYNNGYADGYDAGYANGFYDGYNSYAPARKGGTFSLAGMMGLLSTASSPRDRNFDHGYSDGYKDAVALK